MRTGGAAKAERESSERCWGHAGACEPRRQCPVLHEPAPRQCDEHALGNVRYGTCPWRVLR
eukprot:2846343-Rhodomonas_salina.1